MGKVLKILGVLFILAVLAFAGLLYWGHQAGESAQEDFFHAVLSGDAAQVKALFHPDLAAQIDEPVLAAWVKAVREHLGAYKSLSGTNFNTSVKQTGGHKVVVSEGTVVFEKGEARSKLRYIDDKIVAWEVKSEALPKNWFTQLEDRSLYDARARTFLQTLMQGNVQEALAQMHENLRVKFQPETFAKGLQTIAARYGKLDSIEELSHDFKAGPPQELVLRYTLHGAKESAVARVRFQFTGMQGHILGFALPEQK